MSVRESLRAFACVSWLSEAGFGGFFGIARMLGGRDSDRLLVCVFVRVYERLRAFNGCLKQDLRDYLGFSGCWADWKVISGSCECL